MKKVFISLFLLSLLSGSVSAQTASVSLSDDSAQLNYTVLVGGQSFGRTELGGGFLFNDQDFYLAEVVLRVVDEAGSAMPGLLMGLGGKFYGAQSNKTAIMAGAIGGQLFYQFPGVERLGMGIEFYYAPRIVSFIDAERFLEAAGRISYEVVPQAAAFAEYRRYDTKLSGGAINKLDDSFRIGIKLDF